MFNPLVAFRYALGMLQECHSVEPARLVSYDGTRDNFYRKMESKSAAVIEDSTGKVKVFTSNNIVIGVKHDDSVCAYYYILSDIM